MFSFLLTNLYIGARDEAQRKYLQEQYEKDILAGVKPTGYQSGVAKGVNVEEVISKAPKEKQEALRQAVARGLRTRVPKSYGSTARNVKYYVNKETGEKTFRADGTKAPKGYVEISEGAYGTEGKLTQQQIDKERINSIIEGYKATSEREYLLRHGGLKTTPEEAQKIIQEEKVRRVKETLRAQGEIEGQRQSAELMAKIKRAQGFQASAVAISTKTSNIPYKNVIEFSTKENGIVEAEVSPGRFAYLYPTTRQETPFIELGFNKLKQKQEQEKPKKFLEVVKETAKEYNPFQLGFKGKEPLSTSLLDIYSKVAKTTPEAVAKYSFEVVKEVPKVVGETAFSYLYGGAKAIYTENVRYRQKEAVEWTPKTKLGKYVKSKEEKINAFGKKLDKTFYVPGPLYADKDVQTYYTISGLGVIGSVAPTVSKIIYGGFVGLQGIKTIKEPTPKNVATLGVLVALPKVSEKILTKFRTDIVKTKSSTKGPQVTELEEVKVGKIKTTKTKEGILLKEYPREKVAVGGTNKNVPPITEYERVYNLGGKVIKEQAITQGRQFTSVMMEGKNKFITASKSVEGETVFRRFGLDKRGNLELKEMWFEKPTTNKGVQFALKSIKKEAGQTGGIVSLVRKVGGKVGTEVYNPARIDITTKYGAVAKETIFKGGTKIEKSFIGDANYRIQQTDIAGIKTTKTNIGRSVQKGAVVNPGKTITKTELATLEYVRNRPSYPSNIKKFFSIFARKGTEGVKVPVTKSVSEPALETTRKTQLNINTESVFRKSFNFLNFFRKQQKPEVKIEYREPKVPTPKPKIVKEKFVEEPIPKNVEDFLKSGYQARAPKVRRPGLYRAEGLDYPTKQQLKDYARPGINNPRYPLVEPEPTQAGRVVVPTKITTPPKTIVPPSPPLSEAKGLEIIEANFNIPKSRIYPASVNVGKTETRQVPATKVISEVTTVARVKPEVITRAEVKPEVATKVLTEAKTETRALTRTRAETSTKVATEIKTETKVATETKAQTRTQTQTRTILNTPVRITPITPIETPLINIVPTAKQRTGKYEVQVRRQGVFRKVGIFGNPIEAFTKGSTVVRTTAGASFKVLPLGTSEPIRTAPINKRVFYASKREPGVFIQRPQFRISTPGEKKEITYKGIMVNRLRARKGFNIFGG